MSKITVIAIEPCNGRHPGDRWEVSEIEAGELHRAGLVKMAAQPPENKMAPGPSANKASVSVDPPPVGMAAPQSVSPAAQVSPGPIVKTSQRGRPPTRRRGR